MPMNSASLSSEIKAKALAKNADLANLEDNFDWLFDAVAEAVIEHIIANQVVVTSVVNTAVGSPPAETYLSGVGTSTSIS